MKSLIRFSIFTFLVFLISSFSILAQLCENPDNGTGTITLPPMGCQYISPDEVFEIIDGLPPGTTIELEPLFYNFVCCDPPCQQCTLPIAPGACETVGGDLGGYGHCFTGTMEYIVTGTGQLAGFNRFLTLEMFAEVHTGPRNPGDPVQTFPNDMLNLQGQLYGDPDFCTLIVTGGTGNGLPSPGSTTLTQLPSGDFNVDSFFDITYQIEFEGCPGSILEGFAGTTTATIRMQTGEDYLPSIPLFAGDDQYTSPCGTIEFGEGGDCDLPEDFFGPGSDPFDGIITFKGNPSEGSMFPNADVLITRALDINLEPGTSETVPIEIVQLSLKSTDPIKVTYDGGMTESFFDVFVEIDVGSPSTGTSDITQIDDFGGEFDYDITLHPVFTFVELGPGPDRVFSPGGWGYSSADPTLWTLSPIVGEFDVVSDERVILQSPAGTTIELLPLPIRYDNFIVSVDESGGVENYEGSGWNNGTWYYYPWYPWTNVWFYDHPYDPNRQKIINGTLELLPRDPGQNSTIEIVWNWTTPLWPGWPDNDRPPLPEDVDGDPYNEDDVIVRQPIPYFFNGIINGPIPIEVPFEILNYNPEWISVDIRGSNFVLNGDFQHICWKPGDCSDEVFDFGDAPDDPYPTLAINNGAHHFIDGAVYMGSQIDAEIDGLQDPQALGDDNDGIDDEDGVNFITGPLIPGEMAQLEVIIPTTAVGAFLTGWIDFDGNGSWLDLGDQIIFNHPVVAGVNPLSFYVPAFSTFNSNTFARFRLSNTFGLSFYDFGQNGEVEDYTVEIDENPSIKWEQLPDRNVLGFHCHDSQGSELHNADDWVCSGGQVTGFSWWGNYELPSGPIFGFRIGIYDNDVSGPYNKPGNLLWTVDAPMGMNPGEVMETPSGLVSNAGDIIYYYQHELTEPFPQEEGTTYWFDLMALSVDPNNNNVIWKWQGNDDIHIPAVPVQWDNVSGYNAQLSINNLAYVINSDIYPVNLDFGDAPDGPYPTLLTNNGARHVVIPGIQLGNLIDSEPDGQPDPQSLGDDLDLVYPPANNDEDGVTFNTPLFAGGIFTMTVTTPSPGLFLQVWIDYNQNGSWADIGDHIIQNQPLNNLSNIFNYVIPIEASTGQTYMRFRYSGLQDLSYDGFAPDGEVEDYLVAIGPLNQGTIMDLDPNGIYVQNEISMDWAPARAENPPIILAAYNDHPYPGGPGLGVSYSTDDGTSWTILQLPYPPDPFGGGNFIDAFDPTVTIDGNGDLFVAHISTDYNWAIGPASGLYVHKSLDRGVTWQPPVAIATDGPPPANPALYRFNDRCQMTADINSASPYYNNLYIVEIKDRGWSQPLPWSDIYFSSSTDGGATWSTQVILNEPIHDMGNMPVPAVASDGTIFVCWMDYNVITGGSGTIFMDMSTDGGVNWLATDIFVTTVNLPPLNLNGGTDALAKGAAVIEVSPFNPQHVYIAYAERVAGTSDEGDIFFIRSTDAGVTWSNPLRVNDDATFNDQVLPWMDVKPNGTIDIVWYDRRNDPLDYNWDVYMAMSTNGGTSFMANVQVNSTLPAVTPNTPSGDWMGEYLGLTTNNTTAYVGYTSSITDIGGDVYFDKIDNPTIDMDFGDASDPSYPTLLASNGARHILDGATFLGASVDADPDGQQSPNADGDDLDGNDDEDGVTFNWPLAVGSPCRVTVNASVANGYLNGWVDFNGNGSWADPGEKVFDNKILLAGDNPLGFIVPAGTTPGLITYARFRYTTYPIFSFDGLAQNGEVEDYEVEIIENEDYKWAQYPDVNLPGLHAHDYDLGNYQAIVLADDWLCSGGVVTDIHWWGNYEMDASNNELRGAGIDHFHISIHNHDYSGGCLPHNTEILGFNVTFDPTLEQNTGLINLEGSPIYLYEYILPEPFAQDEGARYWIDITAVSVDPTNPPSWRWQEAMRSPWPILCGAAEKIMPSPGTWSTIIWPYDPDYFTDMAFIITSAEEEPMDFGDAADPTYPTLLANDGARHIIDPTMYLGNIIDPELDGQPHPNALGDDNDGTDDEDGVTINALFSNLIPNGSIWYDIVASNAGTLNVWIDWDANDSWAEADNHAAIDVPLVSGTNSTLIGIPATAVIGNTYARFRFSSAAGLSYTGTAPDGEVEDYELIIGGDVDVNLKVFLEGPFNGSNMNTDLNIGNLIPLSQPYNSDATAPWYYTGTESVVSIPNPNVVDWVMVEFRDAPSPAAATSATMVSQQAAFILNDGSIVSLDGVSPIQTNGLFNHNLYVVIWHRNHLGIMSSGPIVPTGINQYSYDFSGGPGQAYLSGQINLGGGIYGLAGGDGKPDGFIDNQDIISIWILGAGTTGYLMVDYNLDTQVDNQDKNNIWYPNISSGSQIP